MKRFCAVFIFRVFCPVCFDCRCVEEVHQRFRIIAGGLRVKQIDGSQLEGFRVRFQAGCGGARESFAEHEEHFFQNFPFGLFLSICVIFDQCRNGTGTVRHEFGFRNFPLLFTFAEKLVDHFLDEFRVGMESIFE